MTPLAGPGTPDPDAPPDRASDGAANGAASGAADGPAPVRRWSLNARLLLFLSLALLPLGIVAIFQTVQVIEETRRLAERDVLARSAQAASAQRALVERAFGSAEAAGAAAARLSDRPATCSAIMRDLVDREADFAFAGFVEVDGRLACGSDSAPRHFDARPDWDAFIANPDPRVIVSRAGAISGRSVYVVLVPVFDPETGDLRGGQAISIPNAAAPARFASDAPGLDLALVNPEGEILASSTGMDDLGAFERRGVVPEALNIPPDGLLVQPDASNPFNRPTAVVPMVEGEVYVLGLWTESGMGRATAALARGVPIFPLLMWLASLAVAWLTISSLILRPLAQMSRQMRRYRAETPESARVSLPDAPREIAEIAGNYNALLGRVAADTAQLKDNLAEKETLLREVHHRVKNNLQLITSILNIQMRQASDVRARRILSRVQDRVMSLASVHRALYAGARLQEARADHLLRDIMASVVDHAPPLPEGVELSMAFEPVVLDPDQVVPLALLATEAMTNAVKNVRRDGAGACRIRVGLRAAGTRQVVFVMENTCAPVATPPPESAPEGSGAGRDDGPPGETDPGAGLGSRLIASFAAQLGGAVEIDETPQVYRLKVRFDRLDVA